MTNQSKIKFTKMHGLGNDFVVIDAINQPFNIQQFPIQKLSHRYMGIGFDQLLLIESSKKADFLVRFFNADGSEAEQCGNGVRCVARFLHENKLLKKNTLQIETKAGIVEIIIHDYDHIQVNMGAPSFDDAKIPFVPYEELSNVTALSMGNPHAILKVASIKDHPVATLGKQIATHTAFPQGANVGFMEIVNPQHIRLRTFERGVGETYACGSNACAAVVAGIKNNLLDTKVSVELEFGELIIEWRGGESPVFMTGPAVKVFEGLVLG